MWMAVKRRASTKTISPSHLSNHPTLWVFLQTTSYLQHWRQAMIHITPFWHPINVNYNIDGGRAGRWSRGAGGAPFHINTVNIQSKVGSRHLLRYHPMSSDQPPNKRFAWVRPKGTQGNGHWGMKVKSVLMSHQYRLTCYFPGYRGSWLIQLQHCKLFLSSLF